MWTATITNVSKDNGMVNIVVTFTDGKETVTETFQSRSANDAWLRSVVRSRIDSLTASYAYAASLVNGSSVDTTVAPKTQAEIDLDDFMTKYSHWQQIKKAVDIGIITGAETSVVNAKNAVTAAFKPAYLQFL